MGVAAGSLGWLVAAWAASCGLLSVTNASSGGTLLHAEEVYEQAEVSEAAWGFPLLPRLCVSNTFPPYGQILDTAEPRVVGKVTSRQRCLQ